MVTTQLSSLLAQPAPASPRQAIKHKPGGLYSQAAASEPSLLSVGSSWSHTCVVGRCVPRGWLVQIDMGCHHTHQTVQALYVNKKVTH